MAALLNIEVASTAHAMQPTRNDGGYQGSLEATDPGRAASRIASS
jgi:hypothetical protein